jgi:hypothetical protein
MDDTRLSEENYKGIKSESLTPSSLEALNLREVRRFDSENITPIVVPTSGPGVFEVPGRAVTRTPPIDDLYFEPEFTSTELQTALRLLGHAIKHCDRAIEYSHRSLTMEVDSEIHHIQVLLPEVFCCRRLGDGFGAIVDSVQNALRQNRGLTLAGSKLRALHSILTVARNKPFIKFEEAVEVIIEFESNEFIVEPPGFDLFAELLDE